VGEVCAGHVHMRVCTIENACSVPLSVCVMWLMSARLCAGVRADVVKCARLYESERVITQQS
jgi:hypothetical protein